MDRPRTHTLRIRHIRDADTICVMKHAAHRMRRNQGCNQHDQREADPEGASHHQL